MKTYVDDGSVYELTRIYRKNKANPELVHMIVTVRKKNKKDSEKYYITSYRVSSTESQENFKENFKVPRHGNALKPTAASYYRTDKKVLEQAAASLTENKSCAAVYENLASLSLSSVSSELCNPKQVQNIKQAISRQDLASQGNSTQSSSNDEMTRIVSQMRSTNSSELFTRLVTILPEHYFSVHFTDGSIQDVEQFCVYRNSVFRIDTTFEIVNNFWVTDASYTNESLISELTGKNPEFPGPIMLHFKKDRPTYRAFAGHLAIANPKLFFVKKIGSDMDPALSEGVGDIFSQADKLVCLQHLMEWDAFNLQKLGATTKAKQRIMCDIYGSKQNRLLQFGLADADNTEDFNVKLESLKYVWEPLVPGFHKWFKERRAELFKSTIISSAKDRIGISEPFYNNRLEVMHKLQKKKLFEEATTKEVTDVINALKEWQASYRSEAVRDIRGIGKYRLAPAYQQFGVDPVRWMQWSV